MRTGYADLPLHWGKAPVWLFSRMKDLAGSIVGIIVVEKGPEEVLRFLSDPFWFQAFGCVLGFDWHSSGLTTTVCGALKEALRGRAGEYGLWVAGGKGGTSRKTPGEIESAADWLKPDYKPLIYASRMSAKVDSGALQDGYQIYHHNFIFTREGKWAVIQQGMNPGRRTARRYHWLGEKIISFVDEPHQAICAEAREKWVLDMTAHSSAAARKTCASLSREKPDILVREIRDLQALKLPPDHPVTPQDINPDRLHRIFLSTYENQPRDFTVLLGLSGVGPKTIRALSLISELVYGDKPSHRDPARFSFAHGGKDGYPYPVNRETYDQSIDFLRRALKAAKVGRTEKIKAFRRLESLKPPIFPEKDSG